MTRFRSFLTVFLFVATVSVGADDIAGGKSPSAVVGSFQEMLIEVMKTAENTTVSSVTRILNPVSGGHFTSH